jgi:peptidoglycan hydrolase-like protein with peptidoglycan-binding domain
MQNLSGTVGERGANTRHDSALVQAILVLTRRPANLDPQRSKYLAVIDGDCGDRTKGAIRQFQYDQVFVAPGGGRSKAVPGVTAGLISPDDVTWREMTAAMPNEFNDLRVLNGSKTVYVAGTQAQRNARVDGVGRLTFQATFRGNVIALINRIYDRHGIAIGVCRTGDRRTFQTQYELLTSGRRVTNAGPGESNHNFGQAVDLGFEGLRWLERNGTIVEDETSWLHRLDPQQRATGEALMFWNMLRNEGAQICLHRGPVDDRPHLQAWRDAEIDMATRLADLLTRAGRMRWTGRRQRYQCDLGFGGLLFDVGTAAQIWNRQATITAATLTQARAQVGAQPLVGAGAARQQRAPQGAQAGAPAVTPQDIAAMRESLRGDFDAADGNWQTWRAR